MFRNEWIRRERILLFKISETIKRILYRVQSSESGTRNWKVLYEENYSDKLCSNLLHLLDLQSPFKLILVRIPPSYSGSERFGWGVNSSNDRWTSASLWFVESELFYTGATVKGIDPSLALHTIRPPSRYFILGDAARDVIGSKRGSDLDASANRSHYNLLSLSSLLSLPGNWVTHAGCNL